MLYKECFKNFEKSEQKDIFDHFYSGQCKEAQDTYLAGCMNCKLSEYTKVTVDPKEIRENTWNFQMKKNGSDVTVCRVFVIDVHKYDVEHTGKPLTMAYKTYYKFYRETNYFVRRPKTDVCDFCTECKKNLENYSNHPCLLAYKLHKKKAESLSLQPVPPKQLKKAQIKDVTDLLPYLSEENRGFYQDIYDTQLPTVSRQPTEAENSVADFDLDEDDVMEEE
ncbi:hypothetical protein PR048_021733 [Dryococelus australis]|uniref:Uncharacterized protein n=1 Tax=Dryococelus australis TaxID=614101 RepID=A0ABQ9GZ02_9NEOP|nr:hypothetical protein PR048_021733 [Dryococelus australis]